MKRDNLGENLKECREDLRELSQVFKVQTQLTKGLSQRAQRMFQRKLWLTKKLDSLNGTGGKEPQIKAHGKEQEGKSDMVSHQAKVKEQERKVSPRKRRYKRGREDLRNNKFNDRAYSREKQTPRRDHLRNNRFGVRLNSSKIFKVEGKKCRMNLNQAHRFIFNKEVDLYENQFIEFKQLKGLHLQMIVNYICGFLNSFGGTLFIGITDDGFIRGIRLDRGDIDKFMVDLDRCLRQFSPTVFPEQIKLTFHEIVLNHQRKVIFTSMSFLISSSCKSRSSVIIAPQCMSPTKASCTLRNWVLSICSQRTKLSVI